VSANRILQDSFVRLS